MRPANYYSASSVLSSAVVIQRWQKYRILHVCVKRDSVDYVIEADQGAQNLQTDHIKRSQQEITVPVVETKTLKIRTLCLSEESFFFCHSKCVDKEFLYFSHQMFFSPNTFAETERMCHFLAVVELVKKNFRSVLTSHLLLPPFS
jgi:hypothetical protein